MSNPGVGGHEQQSLRTGWRFSEATSQVNIASDYGEPGDFEWEIDTPTASFKSRKTIFVPESSCDADQAEVVHKAVADRREPYGWQEGPSAAIRVLATRLG